MKFETKMAKLGINEEEVKSIIENCECGEINGAYFIDLTKEKKEFIIEVIGNYLDDDSEEFEGWSDIRRISTFCKVFGISEDEIADYYRLGFNEGGCDIAYNLESNKDVILVLTDDERYNNSFIKYSHSQQKEEPATERFVANYNYGDKYIYDVNLENEYNQLKTELKTEEETLAKLEATEITEDKTNPFSIEERMEARETAIASCKAEISEIKELLAEVESELFGNDEMEESIVELTAQYDEAIDELTQLDDETNVDEICTDKELMAEYESKKEQIEDKINEIADKIEEAQEMEESEMEEKIVEFRLISKQDNRIYLKGNWDISNYEENTDDGDWEYQQNDGTMASHIPSYWSCEENLSFEFSQFIDSIDWEIFRQWLIDCQNENRSVDCGDYILHINDGASVEVTIEKDDDFDENYMAIVKFTYNGKPITFDMDIGSEFAESLQFDNDNKFLIDVNTSEVYMEIPKTFSEYIGEDFDGQNDGIIQEWIDSCRTYIARQLSRDAGIYNQYGELIEQQVEDGISIDYSSMYEFKCAIEDDTIRRFLYENLYLDEEE